MSGKGARRWAALIVLLRSVLILHIDDPMHSYRESQAWYVWRCPDAKCRRVKRSPLALECRTGHDARRMKKIDARGAPADSVDIDARVVVWP